VFNRKGQQEMTSIEQRILALVVSYPPPFD
jgi:hypothetical protein